MIENRALDVVYEWLLKRNLSEALAAMESYVSSYSGAHGADRLYAIKADFQLMSDYWKRGFKDPQLPNLYDSLLRRLYVLYADADMSYQIKHSAYLSSIHARLTQASRDWTVQTLKEALVEFVSAGAMLALEPQHTRAEKKKELHRRHHQLITDWFDRLWLSAIWGDGQVSAMEEILLSPTIDVNDQLMIISAISLSLQNAFDINKFKVLTTLYQQSSDNHVRQRALVGWVLAVDSSEAEIFPEVVEIVNTICQDDLNCKELTELQMQLYYCIDTDNDQKTIHDEIMPDLVNGSRIQMSQGGEFDMDEDSLEDILHPEALERDMEKMEKSMKRMADMQKQGADIYYSGFRQMKRFPFFQDISNWFAPFMPNHPAIAHSWEKAKGSKMLHYIADIGSFCDSDKYSLVLAFEQVRNQLPSKMIEMMDNGAATPMPVGGEV